ncbi:serine/threonine-protein kinase [Lujinxingia litoralis]|nr:serine/threonine-protein kinase [Lujinxingia litoralis]
MTHLPGTSSPSLVGTLVDGKYLLERELGAGGMGAVYLARHQTIEREVAVKLLHRSLAQDEAIRRRFEIEARAIGRLSHPGCVMLYEFGYEAEIEALYAIFEYVRGHSLEKWAGQQLTLEDVLEVARQVVSAIGHAHSQKIIHRDLKPDNIMIAITESGKLEVKVLDFGIARIAEDDEADEQSRLTRMGQMFGTPPYMSPEQIRAKLNVTFASDIYSIGVILYELIEGRLPFLADSPIETVMLHLNEEVPPMERSDLPDALRAIVMRCLKKEPTERFESCQALGEALDRVVLQTSDATALTQVVSLRGEKAAKAPEVMASDPQHTALEFGIAPTLAAAQTWEKKDSARSEAELLAETNEGAGAAADREAGLRPVGVGVASGLSSGGVDESVPQAPDTWPEMSDDERRASPMVWIVGVAVVLLLGVGLLWQSTGESDDSERLGEGAQVEGGSGPASGVEVTQKAAGEKASSPAMNVEDEEPSSKGAGAGALEERGLREVAVEDEAPGEEPPEAASKQASKEAASRLQRDRHTSTTSSKSDGVQEALTEPARLRLEGARRLKKSEAPESTEEPARLTLPGR